MPYIDQQKLLEATRGGLDIILMYYPDAKVAEEHPHKKFKIRKESTASASLKKLKDGNYVVTDFGADSTPRNGIQICMLEEGLEFRDAIQYLAAHFGIAGSDEKPAHFEKEYEKQPAQEGDEEGQYKWEYKEFSEAELRMLGPQVSEEQCLRHKLYSLESYWYVKKDKKTGELVRHVFKSTEHYPIFQFVFTNTNPEDGEWGKRLEPRAKSKADRFRYFGIRPDKDHIMGLHLVKRAWKKLNEDDEEDYESMDEMEQREARKDKKLPEVIICGGDRDSLATEAATGCKVVWLNSETAKVTYSMMRELEKYAHRVYYLGDIDKTGLKVQHKLGMQHLDLHLIRLPDSLRERKDHRGNPCKDVRDFLEYNKPYKLRELIKIAVPMRLWDQSWENKGTKESPRWFKKFTINPLQTYNFLEANGYYRFRLPNVKTGYIYIKIANNTVEEIDPVEIKNFVNNFLKEINAEPNLRNAFYRSRTQLGEQSLSNLSLIDLDFTDYTSHSQYFFFQNTTWEVTRDGIVDHGQGNVDNYVWHDEVIDHKAEVLESPFEVFDNDGLLDIKVKNKGCLFLRYLINASRIYWQEQDQLRKEGKELSEEKKHEQRLHLINKLYSLGYLLHRYKDPNRPWAVYAMDAKIAEDEFESHGGSGKSIAYKAVRYFMKSVNLEGRNPKLTENPHIYENVTNHTDFILIDDANQYLKFDFFYSQLTGEMTVNPKHGKQYEIPFEEVPKMAITSNYALRDTSPSTSRRLLYTVFSDYYHFDKDGEYEGSWSPADEFGKNLFTDFTEEEWNLFFNTMASCVQLYLNYGKIDPPMEEVTARNQIREMTQEFKEWAEVYFAEDANADTMVVKEDAQNDFNLQVGGRRKFSSNRFKKSLRIFCKFKGYVFNPSDLVNNDNRIMNTVEGKTKEFIYVQAFQTSLNGFDGQKVPQKGKDDNLPF